MEGSECVLICLIVISLNLCLLKIPTAHIVIHKDILELEFI